jgi:hypothetical protein
LVTVRVSTRFELDELLASTSVSRQINQRRRKTMLLTEDRIPVEQFERGTGWALRPEGACRGDVCVPLTPGPKGDRVDVAPLAKQLGMPIVRHSRDLAALGPASLGGKALTSAEAPDLVLPDFAGREFDLRSVRGQKVVLVAWSPY